MTGSYEKTNTLIRDHLDALHRIASALLERETLDSKDLDEILGNASSPPDGQAGGKPGDRGVSLYRPGPLAWGNHRLDIGRRTLVHGHPECDAGLFCRWRPPF